MMPNMSSAQELVVDVGGGSAEQGTGGVMINVVPKDGGNRFSGNAFVAGANGSMQGDNFTQRVKDRGLKVVNSLKRSFDVSGAFGGPIVHDKVWFFASGRTLDSQNYVGGMYYNLNEGLANVWKFAPDVSRPAYNHSTQRAMNGRATWQANAKNKISGYYDRQQRCVCLQVSALTSPEAAGEFWYPISDLGSVTWTYTASNRLLVQAGATKRFETYEFYARKADWATKGALIPVFDQTTLVNIHGVAVTGFGAFVDADQSMPKVRGSVSYVGGRHELKVGFENEWMKYSDIRRDNNYQLGYTFANGLPVSLQQRANDFDTVQKTILDLGMYVQDKWSWNRLTLNGGLRFEWFKTSFGNQFMGPTINASNRNFTVAGGGWHNMKDLAPRMSAVYDLFGNGKTAIKSNANRYVARISGAPLAGSPSLRVNTQATRSWTDGLTTLPVGDPRRGNFSVDCDLTSPAENGECGGLSNIFFGKEIPSLTYDPKTYQGFGNHSCNWEFSAGMQQQVLPRVSVDVAYFRRVYGNFLVTDNRALSPADYDPFSIMAPVDSRLPGGGGYQISSLYDLKPEKVALGTVVNNLQTFSSNFGNQIEHWDGVDFNVNARLPRGVIVQGGFSTGRTRTDNCDVVTKLDNPSTLYCNNATLFLTDVKALATYVIPKIDVRLSATLQSQPGPVVTATYIATNAQVIGLGRPLSTSSVVSLNIVEPGKIYV